MVGRQRLTEKERKLLRREQKGKKLSRLHRQRKVKKILMIAAVVLIVGGGILGGGLLLGERQPSPGVEMIAARGIHWHTVLTIKILGQYQEIPANIGLGIAERPIHTHETDGVIHMEFPGLVAKNDVRLGQFFTIWGKEFSQECIFDKCNGAEGEVRMLVNGKLNFEFENYIMRDEDKIEVIFEK